MKLCIPSMGNKGLDEAVGEHFGRVPNYTVFETETKEVTILDNTSEHMGGSGFPAEILTKAGINTMLCGGLGRGAISMFEGAGVMVFVGATGTVQETIDMWKAGQLQAATDENACAQHAYRGDGIGEGQGHEHHHHDH